MKKRIIEIAVKVVVAALTAFLTAHGLRPFLKQRIPAQLSGDSLL